MNQVILEKHNIYPTMEKLPCFWKEEKSCTKCAPCAYRKWQSEQKIQDTVYHHGVFDVVFVLLKEGLLFIHRRVSKESEPSPSWVRNTSEKLECGNIPIKFDAFRFTEVRFPELVGGISAESGGGIRGWLRSSGKNFSINMGQSLSGIEGEYTTCVIL